MAQEFFDVINEKGDYTGEVETREKCHKEGLWHKAVAVFIINSKKQVLLQKRSALKKAWPNMWDISAGGHVLSKEFGFQSIIRELKEELGVDINQRDILFIGSAISSEENGNMKNNHFNEYYIVNKEIDTSKLKIQEEEVSDVKWFEMNEIIERINDNYKGITTKTECWNYLKKYYELIVKK